MERQRQSIANLIKACIGVSQNDGNAVCQRMDRKVIRFKIPSGLHIVVKGIVFRFSNHQCFQHGMELPVVPLGVHRPAGREARIAGVGSVIHQGLQMILDPSNGLIEFRIKLLQPAESVRLSKERIKIGVIPQSVPGTT